MSTLCAHSRRRLGRWFLSIAYALRWSAVSLVSSRPRLHLPFCSAGRKNNSLQTPTLPDTTTPCGLIKLLRWLLSVSPARPLAWTSGGRARCTVTAWRAPVVRAGRKGAERGGDDIQAHGGESRGGWRMSSNSAAIRNPIYLDLSFYQLDGFCCVLPRSTTDTQRLNKLEALFLNRLDSSIGFNSNSNRDTESDHLCR